MSDFKRDYEAAYVCSLMNGEPIPTFEEVVLGVIRMNKGTTLKREDIVAAVAHKIGTPVDASIAGAVSIILKRLADEDTVVQDTQHGYWYIY